MTTNRKGVLAILGGTAGGQIIAFVVAPILSRVYSPSDFGLFTVVSALIMTIGTVAALRFELAVPLPKREQDAHSLVMLGLASALATAVAGTGVIAVAGSWIARSFKQPHLMPWLWVVPATASVLGAFLVLNQLAVRHRRYSAIGRRNLLQSVVSVLAQVAAGTVGVRPGGLVLGFGIGQAVGTLSLVAGSGLRSDEARAGRTWANMRSAATRYRRFPLLLAPSGLLNVAGIQLPVLLIAYHYGPEVAGWLGLTQRVLALPVMLVGKAVGQVYLSELARTSRDGSERSKSFFFAASRRLGMVAVFAAVALLVTGPWAFAVVFGDGWAESGLYAQALSVSLGAQLVATPVSQTLTVFERYTLQLGWDAGRLLVIMGAVTACWLLGGSALQAVWAFSIASMGAYAVSWILSRAVIRANHCARKIGTV